MLIVNYDVFTVQLCSVRKRDKHDTRGNLGTGLSSVTLSPVEQLCQLSRGCLPETQLHKLETRNHQACVVILCFTLQSFIFCIAPSEQQWWKLTKYICLSIVLIYNLEVLYMTNSILCYFVLLVHDIYLTAFVLYRFRLFQKYS